MKFRDVKAAVARNASVDDDDPPEHGKLLKQHYEKTKRADNGAYLRNRSALAVICRVIIHCFEVSCKEDKITSVQGE